MDNLEPREAQGNISSLRSGVLQRAQEEGCAGLHMPGFSFEIHESVKSFSSSG